MLILAEEQLRAVLRIGDLIPAMEKALIDFSAGFAVEDIASAKLVHDRTARQHSLLLSN